MLISFESPELNRFNIYSAVKDYFTKTAIAQNEYVCGIAWYRKSDELSAISQRKITDAVKAFYDAETVTVLEFDGLSLSKLDIDRDFIRGSSFIATFYFCIAVKRYDNEIFSVENIIQSSVRVQ